MNPDFQHPALTLDALKLEAVRFARQLSAQAISTLYGVTDGKAVGTYVEQTFRSDLAERYTFQLGNSAIGIDFPALAVDLKVTSIRQPQSSSPFRDASQKVYGLGYSLLVMTYDKTDDPGLRSSQLNIVNLVFIAAERTADYQTTTGISEILKHGGTVEEIVAFLEDRNLPLDDMGRETLARRIVADTPLVGYLTISNALQWRLQYGRAVATAAEKRVDGVEDLLA